MRMPRLACRATAIAVAALGTLDPRLAPSLARPLPVDIAIVTSALDRLPSGTGAGSRADAARRSAQTMAGALGSARASISSTRPAEPLACRTDAACVVITDGARPLSLPVEGNGLLFGVHVGETLSPNVAIVSTRSELETAIGAEGVVQLTLQGLGVAGRSTNVRVLDSAATVGETTHRWTGDGEATVSVRWWPLASHARVLRVVADPLPDEAADLDNAAELSIAGLSGRMPVLVFEPRPSWTSTFVRRSLEADPRLQVAARTRLGPTVTAGTGVGLDEAALTEMRAVVLGAPDAITNAEAALLDRYVHERGGSLIVLPDRGLTGPLASMVPGTWTERLEPAPVAAGPLRASELLLLDTAGPYDRVLASAADPSRPVIVAFPAGQGRIIVSGAQDAWRHRSAADSGFDRFWRSAVSNAAVVSGAPVGVVAWPSLVERGQQVEFTIRRRGFDRAAPAVVRAAVVCGPRSQPLRLWPTGDPAAWSAVYRPEASGLCRVDAEVDDRHASVEMVVVDDAGTAERRSFDRLDERARASGGLSVQAGGEQAIIDALRAKPAAPAEPIEWHPLRSPWWIVPFAVCLGVEWWDRRRAGLR